MTGFGENNKLSAGGRLFSTSILMGVKEVEVVGNPVVSSGVITKAFLVLRHSAFLLAALLMC